MYCLRERLNVGQKQKRETREREFGKVWKETSSAARVEKTKKFTH